MAAARRSSALTSLVALAFLAAGCGVISSAFTGLPLSTRSSRVARANYDSGKVNLGVDATLVDKTMLPEPVLNVDASTTAAITECLEEGCSVEALMALDAKLAADEKEIAETMGVVAAKQKTEYSEEAATALAWFDNSLQRMGTLRAQLHALKATASDSDFIQQMMKAASVAFGGGRHGHYPKVGVSSYSA